MQNSAMVKGRPVKFPEVVQFRLPAGTIAAVEARALPGEGWSDLWRRMVEEWLAGTPIVKEPT